MASIRPCNKCGERISIRQMPHKQWVAFNVGTDDPHKCKKKNIKINKQNNKKKSEPYESLSLKQNENFDYKEPDFVEDQFSKEQEEIENLKNLNKTRTDHEISNNDDSLLKNPLFIAFIIIIFLALFIYP